MARDVSLHLLVARAEAFPLESEAAFHNGLVSINRSAPGMPDSRTNALGCALEEDLRGSGTGLSIEVLRQVTSQAWFPGMSGPASVPLSRYVQILAGRYLTVQGGGAAVRDGPGVTVGRSEREDPDFDRSERVASWRWITFYLPPDLLVAALFAAAGTEPTRAHVSLASPHLARILDRDVANTHLHQGAAVSFDRLWAGAMVLMARDPVTTGELVRLGFIPFALPHEPPPVAAKRYLRLLYAAAIARVLLAAYLWHRDLGVGGPSTFGEFMAGPMLRRIASEMCWPWGPRLAARELTGATALLLGSAVEASPARLESLYRSLISDVSRAPLPDLPEYLDPLAAWLPARPQGPLPESRFIWRACRYLESSAPTGQQDEAFARLFWQYQRVRCRTYCHLVEDPGTAGLDWFSRHYERIQLFRGRWPVSDSALKLESVGLRLSSLEVRTAPDASWTRIRDNVRALGRAAINFGDGAPEVGLVLHFIKNSHRSGVSPPRLQADPRHDAHPARYGPWFYDRFQEGLAIEQVLAEHPELLLLLRGLDVANQELAVPTWVLVPLLTRLRNASQVAARRLERMHPEWRVPPFRQTLHAGEEYRRLVEGLRRVHEPIECRVIRTGDRFGHAVAVGDDPGRWAVTARELPQPREERLDDLLWELERYGKGDLPTTNRLERVRAEAVGLAHEIYAPCSDGAESNVDDLIEARRLRHQPRVLERLGYPSHVRVPPRRSAERLLFLYLTDPGVFERGQPPVVVETVADEVEMLRQAQRWLRSLLGRLEITVESNPSSNLLVADMARVEDHPIFRMQPLPHQPAVEGGNVLISVNDDDPLTFATRLSDEYAYLYAALLRQKVPAQDALSFVDTVRENGWRSRFTIEASASADVLKAVVRGDHRTVRTPSDGTVRFRGAWPTGED